MTQGQIKNLEKELWDAADELRGNSKLTAGEYKDPLLGLVLLRFARLLKEARDILLPRLKSGMIDVDAIVEQVDG